MVHCRSQEKPYCSVSKLIHDDGYPIPMLFCQNPPLRQSISKWAFVSPIAETHLSKVDFPAPKNPQIMVKGTRVERSNLDVEFVSTETLGTSMSDLEMLETQIASILDAHGGSSSESSNDMEVDWI
jgi:hypothetical protein